MAFKTTGKIDCTVTEAFIAEPRFTEKPGEQNNAGQPVGVYADVCLVLSDAEGHTDTWRGELSNRNGRGNMAAMYQTDITLKTLQDIGFGVTTMQELYDQCQEGAAGITLPNLIGLECTATAEERTYTGRDGQEHTVIQTRYLNARGAGGPARMSLKDFSARLGMTPAAPAPAYQQPAQTPAQMFGQKPAAPAKKSNCPY